MLSDPRRRKAWPRPNGWRLAPHSVPSPRCLANRLDATADYLRRLPYFVEPSDQVSAVLSGRQRVNEPTVRTRGLVVIPRIAGHGWPSVACAVALRSPLSGSCVALPCAMTALLCESMPTSRPSRLTP